MNKLEKAKEIIAKYIDDAKLGIFCTRNVFGDPMSPLYHHYQLDDNIHDFLRIEICYPHEYFEVFGLSNEEFNELKTYYEEIRKEAYDRYWEELLKDEDEEIRKEASDRYREELLKNKEI